MLDNVAYFLLDFHHRHRRLVRDDDEFGVQPSLCLQLLVPLRARLTMLSTAVSEELPFTDDTCHSRDSGIPFLVVCILPLVGHDHVRVQDGFESVSQRKFIQDFLCVDVCRFGRVLAHGLPTPFGDLLRVEALQVSDVWRSPVGDGLRGAD